MAAFVGGITQIDPDILTKSGFTPVLTPIYPENPSFSRYPASETWFYREHLYTWLLHAVPSVKATIEFDP